MLWFLSKNKLFVAFMLPRIGLSGFSIEKIRKPFR